MHSRFDIAVIGASLAGATVAGLLAKQGLTVALFDKATFPRRKPCGEGLSSAGLALARRLQLWPENPPFPHLTYRGYTLHAGGRQAELVPPEGGGITCPREYLDEFIVHQATRHSGVEFFENTAVRTIGSQGQLATDHHRVHASIIVIADGSNSPLARQISAPTRRTGAQRQGASAIFRGRFSVDPSFVHIFIERESELYATPLPDGALNVSALAPLNSSANIRTLLLDRACQTRVFNKLGFTGTLADPPLGRSPIGNIIRSSPRSDVFLIGDSIEEFDPIGGMGMTHALLSAALAAPAIVEALSGISDAVRRYEQERFQAARGLRGFTSFSYRMLRGAYHVPVALSLAGSPLGRQITSLMLPKDLPV